MLLLKASQQQCAACSLGGAAPHFHLHNTRLPQLPGHLLSSLLHQVPADILHNAALNAAIAILPGNYNFEIHKTVWRIRQVRYS